MAQQDMGRALPSLQDSLYAATVTELKWYAAGLPGVMGTRKDDLVANLHQALTDRAGLERLWTALSPDQRLAVAEVVHGGGGRYDPAALTAKYPGVSTPRSSRIWYSTSQTRQQKATPFDLFFAYHLDYGLYIPPEVAAVLRTFAPAPPPTAVKSQAQTPVIQRKARRVFDDEDPSDDVLVAETESAVFHDLAATLALVGAGKATVSATTQMPTLPTLRALRGRLLLGDYFPEDYGRAEDAMRPLALVLLVQAAKWAAPGGANGTKLALTPAGQALLASGIGAAQVRDAWQRWLKSDLLDELSRIRNIKGQQSRAVRLTKPATRRPKLSAGLAACPPGRWVLFDDFLRYLLAEQLMPAIESNRETGLYIGYYQEWGTTGYEGPYWDVITGSYLRAAVWEYTATLGLVDLAYTRPEDSPHDFGEMYYMDDDIVSRYDGLLALRLTDLGAFVLGQVATYQPRTPAPSTTEPLLKILPNLDLVLTDTVRALPNIKALLARMATADSDAVYHLSRDVLLDALDSGFTLEQAQAFLAAQSGAPADAWPQTVQRFFADLAERLGALREGGAVLLIEGDDPLVLTELANTTGLRALVQLARIGDRAVLLVPQDQAATVRRQLKKLGYLPRRA